MKSLLLRGVEFSCVRGLGDSINKLGTSMTTKSIRARCGLLESTETDPLRPDGSQLQQLVEI